MAYLTLELNEQLEIQGAALRLSRSFIDTPSDNPFARDLAKSLLEALAFPPEDTRLRRFHAELSDFGASTPVLRHASTIPPARQGPDSELYLAFLGAVTEARLQTPTWLFVAHKEPAPPEPVFGLGLRRAARLSGAEVAG